MFSLKRVGWLVFSIGAFILIGLLIWQPFGWLRPSAELLSKEAAQGLVQDRYQGQVVQIELADQQYHILLEKYDQRYEIKLDAESGEVVSFERISTGSPSPAVELTEDEVRAIVLAMANGELTSVEKIVSNGVAVYQAVVKAGNTQTTLTVDAISGSVLTSTSTTNTIEQAPKNLTASEAGQIAVQQVNGSVDDIDFETQNGLSYYLVEVKTADRREATVQIQAITGEVMSVTWDDRKKSDDDKADE